MTVGETLQDFAQRIGAVISIYWNPQPNQWPSTVGVRFGSGFLVGVEDQSLSSMANSESFVEALIMFAASSPLGDTFPITIEGDRMEGLMREAASLSQRLLRIYVYPAGVDDRPEARCSVGEMVDHHDTLEVDALDPISGLEAFIRQAKLRDSKLS